MEPHLRSGDGDSEVFRDLDVSPVVDILEHNHRTQRFREGGKSVTERSPYRGAFAAAIENGVDIVVADEDEVNALFQTDTFDATLDALEGRDNLFAMTRSARGSVIVHGDQRVIYPATAVDKVVDTTGAGDAWCAGFLYGWANDKPLAECARLGTFCGGRVIQQIGARIEPGLLDDYS